MDSDCLFVGVLLFFGFWDDIFGRKVGSDAVTAVLLRGTRAAQAPPRDSNDLLIITGSIQVQISIRV